MLEAESRGLRLRGGRYLGISTLTRTLCVAITSDVSIRGNSPWTLQNVRDISKTIDQFPPKFDMVGVDNYPPGGTSFAKAYGEFYDGLAARYDKSFCIGETGSFDGGTVERNEAWVSDLTNVDLGRFPCYKSVSWFEYRKASDDGSSPEYDYHIVQGQSRATVNQTLSNFK